MDFIRNLFRLKINSSINSEDLALSRYYPIYTFHNKRIFKEFLEKTTLLKTNELILEIFPKKIYKEDKKKIADCLVIFLKFYSINYDYYNEFKFKTEFNKIIKYNLNKIASN